MNKTRPNRVYFRVTDEELEKINRCVSDSGLTRQDWILKVVTPYLSGGDTTEKKETKTTQETCPKCGAPLKLRNGYKGKFWGCSNYPKCHYTKDWVGD